jgi:hypothetical protein
MGLRMALWKPRRHEAEALIRTSVQSIALNPLRNETFKANDDVIKGQWNGCRYSIRAHQRLCMSAGFGVSLGSLDGEYSIPNRQRNWRFLVRLRSTWGCRSSGERS